MDSHHHRRRRDSYDTDPETNNNESDSMSKSELSRQIEKLHRDLQRRDRELEDERQENLRVLERIKKLERDKIELRREAEDCRDEANEYKKALEEFKYKRKPGEDQDVKEKYEVALQQKNHEIRQLLDDLEKLDGEKSSLQNKLEELKDSLRDATNHLENMTQEHKNIKTRLQKSEGRIKVLQDDKVILEIKLKDLLSFKQRHDQYLENLCSAVDVRVDVWKKMMFQKDEEIDRLNVKIATLANQIPTGHAVESEKATVHQLKMKLLESESVGATLHEKLAQATQDLESATEHINALNAKLKFSEQPEKTGSVIEGLQLKVNRQKTQLEKKDEQIAQLEKEVEEKSKELTNLLSRIHGYETGIYGLSEAIGEIKELKTQIRVRNSQIESLTQELNVLNVKSNDITDENDMLREKLGVRSVDLREETRQFISTRQMELAQLKNRILELEEDIVQLKSKNYSLRKQLQLQVQQLQQNQNQNQNQQPPSQTQSQIQHQNLNQQQQPVPQQHTQQQQIQQQTQQQTHQQQQQQQIQHQQQPQPKQLHSSTEAPMKQTQTQTDEFGKNLAAKFDGTDWKDKYDVILGENIDLRKGLQDILETMHRMTDEGASDVLIQCPILENLLREMSARGLIHYPYGISSFHLKVCNLEGKNSQLREEIHRLKHEEKQNRAELINASATIQSLKEKITFQIESPNSNDMMVLSLQTEIEGLHAQIKHLQDVLSFEQSVDNTDKCVQTQSSQRIHRCSQTENTADYVNALSSVESLQREIGRLTVQMESLHQKVEDQDILIDSKDKVIEDFKIISISHSGEDMMVKNYPNTGQVTELEEALNIARETASSLQDRLKAKEENLNQYRNLLAEIRNEMTAATNRHVQEMRALQLTIYQQQQAFTRMKSTLSQPVKDTVNIEGTIKDQLTRIHELEDEVSELQHTMGNVASQLTSARSEAHRWRCTADARLKELDQARESQTNEKMEELTLLRDKLKQQETKVSELEAETLRLKSTKDSINDIVNVIRNEHYQANAGVQKSGAVKDLQERLTSKETEISDLQTNNKQLQQKISTLQVRVSKMNAVNRHSGQTVEMEQLKSKIALIEDDKAKLETELRNLNKIRDLEEEKKKKAAESMARWEEAKKWKKTVDKLEGQLDALKKENEKLTQLNKNLRANITRLDKMVIDCKKLQPPVKSILKQSEDTIEVEKLKFEIQDLNELVEKTEFEGRENIATLEIEIRCLKERIVSQERQLAAYQVAQKGDPKIVSEIEKMASKEDELQKAVNTLEEENLHLKLQIEQLRLDTPRLRDRVQQLQRLVEVMKSEKPEILGNRANSQKSLSELERTISALKQLIEKLQTENNRLRLKPSSGKVIGGTSSSENLKITLETLMGEKKHLMDQLASLEDEKKKFQKMFIEANSNLESIQIRLHDAERRAKSSEMKLRTFLGDDNSTDEQSVFQRMKTLEEALDRKTKLLDDAKLALRQAACSK